ncbi:hypothetical protein TcBrA4_0017030 [Trypanosoma cruzi]|nr:hypothetical protein TcBrA4_0017030 [Trypanosoma cruzi]
MGFTVGLLSCCEDMGTCCDVCCCFACNTSRQWSAADGIPNNCGLCCCLGSCFFPVISTCLLRQKVSSMYFLQENLLLTFLIGWFCSACSACQTHRELTLRGANPGGCCCQSIFSSFSLVISFFFFCFCCCYASCEDACSSFPACGSAVFFFFILLFTCP